MTDVLQYPPQVMNSSDLLIKKSSAFDSGDMWFPNSSDFVQSLSGDENLNSENKKRKEMEGGEEGSFVSKRARMRATLPHQITIFRFSLPDSDCDDFNEFESKNEVDVEIDESEDEVDVEIDESRDEVYIEIDVSEDEDEVGVEIDESEDEVYVKIDESEDEGADEYTKEDDTELQSEFEEV